MIKYDNSGNDVVLCRVFYTNTQACIAQGILNDNGIDAVLDGELFSRIYPGLDFATIRLMVRRRDLERATGILSSVTFDDD